MFWYWRSVWSDLRASFWLVPSIIVMGAVLAAVACIELDMRIETGVTQRWPRFFGVGADGARATLAAIATAMMTVAGVVFSVTVVTLSLASSQYSPRVLRNFISDRFTQAVLGAFLGIFAYCLVVMRTIRGEDHEAFVPPLATMGGVLLAFAGVGLLVFFIHHIAVSIQASHILATASSETLAAVDFLFPSELGHGEEDDNHPHLESDECFRQDAPGRYPVPAPRTGYLQRVDVDRLLKVACEFDIVVRMECDIGGFVIESMPLFTVAGMSSPDVRTVRRLQSSGFIHRQRSLDQDVAFGIQQIVDVALKSLSPGINDSTTAVMSIDHLTAILARLMNRQFPSALRYAESKLRVVARAPTFASLSALAWDPIRRNAGGNVTVLEHLLHAIEMLSQHTTASSRLRNLRYQLQRLEENVQDCVSVSTDRQLLTERCGRLIQHLTAKLANCKH